MKKDKLHSITLVFENCEDETIPVKNFDAFSLGEIVKKLSLDHEGDLSESYFARDIAMRIKPEGNVFHKGLMDNGRDSFQLFDRITKWSDITQIELSFFDNIEPQLYFIEYEEGKIGNNLWQHNWIDDLGNLWIMITKDEDKVKDYKNFSDTYYVKREAISQEKEVE